MAEHPSERVPSHVSPNPWLKFLIRLAPRGEAAAKLWDELHARREKRMIEMGDAMVRAAAQEGTDAEELLERIAADERLGDLLMMAVEAAAKSRQRRTIAALGRAVASGVLAGDDASIDEPELVIALLGELSAVHIRALLPLAEGAE